VRFREPWRPGPPIDVTAAARRLRIAERAGCDRRPLDPRDSGDRLTLLSYIWPDELERMQRMRAALDLAAKSPVSVTPQPASQWLPGALAKTRRGELTVIWQSIFRQYADSDEWASIEETVRRAARARRQRPVVWLRMEPSDDHLARMSLTFRTDPDQPERRLAWCGDHGPPVLWNRSG
jgi:hypothetical protein